jgi:hypothetical protein
VEKSIFSKLGCCVTLGLLVPLGAAQAWDGSDIQEVSYLEENVMIPTAAGQALSTPQGAQGPIRTDLSEEQPADKKSAAKKQETRFKDFPYPEENKNYRYSEGG